MHIFFVALCLVLVIEGFMPAIAPKVWRRSMARILLMGDNNIRLIGLVSMIIGAVVLYIIRSPAVS